MNKKKGRVKDMLSVHDYDNYYLYIASQALMKDKSEVVADVFADGLSECIGRKLVERPQYEVEPLSCDVNTKCDLSPDMIWSSKPIGIEVHKIYKSLSSDDKRIFLRNLKRSKDYIIEVSKKWIENLQDNSDEIPDADILIALNNGLIAYAVQK